jgi:uncharacterized protein YjbI with pentapeptide repeats
MDFVAGMRACEACGDRSTLKWSNDHSGSVWRTHAKCPSCGAERVYVFSSEEDLTEVQPPELELGPGPSTVFEPRELIAEIARLGAIHTVDFDWDHMERLQTTYNELAKLAPSPLVETQREKLSGLVKVRVAAKRAEAGDDTPPRGSLDAKAQRAHWDWVQRGRKGDGRFDVVGVSATRDKLDGVKAVGGRFERVDFRDSNFNLADWSETELIRCNFNATSINSTRFIAARILDSRFEGAGGATVNFERANIYGTSFKRAGLDGGLFTGATVAATSFEEVTFGNARWDRATFQRCNFKGASLEPTRKVPPSTMRSTMFEQCDFRDVDFTGTDLRGATFENCRFEGAHGVPKLTAGLTVRGGALDTHGLVAQLLKSFSVAEIKAEQAARIVAFDHAPGASAFAVFELAGKKARLIGRTGLENRPALESAGIEVASTFGTTGFVWEALPDRFRLWTTEGMPLEVTRTELKMSGVPSPVSDVKSVALLRDPDRRGRHGIVVKTPEAKPVRLVVVQEDDWVASEDPTYTDEEARRDGEWARIVSRDLAIWLGVPFDDQAS